MAKPELALIYFFIIFSSSINETLLCSTRSRAARRGQAAEADQNRRKQQQQPDRLHPGEQPGGRIQEGAGRTQEEVPAAPEIRLLRLDFSKCK
jgi:hypothetical protein